MKIRKIIILKFIIQLFRRTFVEIKKEEKKEKKKKKKERKEGNWNLITCLLIIENVPLLIKKLISKLRGTCCKDENRTRECSG